MTEVLLALFAPIVVMVVMFLGIEGLYRAGILLVDFVTGGTYE